MSGMGGGGKFFSTTDGHVHKDTPKVHNTDVPPVEGVLRGDIWIQK